MDTGCWGFALPMKHLLWKRRLGQLQTWRSPPRQRSVILLYHSVTDHPPAVSRTRFQEQLAWLNDNASLMGLEELLSGAAFDTGNGLRVALTFDDGYASLHDVVAPLLEGKAGATVYLNTALIGMHQRLASDPLQGHYPNDHFLLWQEVKALARAGWTIGSHGVEHADLTKTSTGQAEQQLRHSRLHIERELLQECRHFAYTWGHYTSVLQKMVKQCGYLTAASGLHGPLLKTSDRYALPRIDVRADYEIDDFIAAVRGQWDFLGYKQRLQWWLQQS